MLLRKHQSTKFDFLRGGGGGKALAVAEVVANAEVVEVPQRVSQ